MFSHSRKSSSAYSTPPPEKDDISMTTDGEIQETLPKYSGNPCPHVNSPPTPVLDAHLRQASTRARLETLRDALNNVINTDENACIKCATTQAAGVLFLYLKDLRETKQKGEYSKAPKKAWKQEIKGLAKKAWKQEIKGLAKKAWKQEIKGLAKEVKRDIGPKMKRSWKERD